MLFHGQIAEHDPQLAHFSLHPIGSPIFGSDIADCRCGMHDDFIAGQGDDRGTIDRRIGDIRDRMDLMFLKLGDDLSQIETGLQIATRRRDLEDHDLSLFANDAFDLPFEETLLQSIDDSIDFDQADSSVLAFNCLLAQGFSRKAQQFTNGTARFRNLCDKDVLSSSRRPAKGADQSGFFDDFGPFDDDVRLSKSLQIVFGNNA
jgi:hypothetical protein